MDCPVCFTSNSQPKRLACSHTVCVECVQSMMDHAGDQECHKEVRCPLCNAPTRIPGDTAATLPTNLLRQRLQTIYNEYSHLADEYRLCDGCDGKFSVIDFNHCHECNIDLCIRCTAKHQDDKSSKGHKVDSKVMLYCKSHKSTCTYFCTRCDHFLCMVCIDDSNICGDHSSNRKPIKDLKAKSEKEIRKYQEQIRACQHEKIKGEDVLQLIHENLGIVNKTKDEVHKHAGNMIEKIKDQERSLMTELDIMATPLIQTESRIRAKEDDKGLEEELFRSAEEGLRGGAEQVIIAASLLREKIPPYMVRSMKELEINVKFLPENSISLGKLTAEKESNNFFRKKGAEGSEDDCMSVDKNEYLKWMPIKIWKKSINVGDVVFTPSGRVAVCDFSNKTVLLYDRDGSLVASSKEKFVTFEGNPWCLAYDTLDSSVIVGDNQSTSLSFLNEENMIKMRQIQVQTKRSIKYDQGFGCQMYYSEMILSVGVQSNGHLVVATKGAIGIHDREGKALHQVTKYGTRDMSYPKYLTVMPDDTVVVSLKWGNNQVVFLSPTLDCLHVVDVMSPRGLTVAPNHDILVAAIKPNRIHYLWKADNYIKQHIIMEFLDDEVPNGKYIRSVAMKDDLLAVLTSNALIMYKYSSKCTTVVPASRLCLSEPCTLF